MTRALLWTLTLVFLGLWMLPTSDAYVRTTDARTQKPLFWNPPTVPLTLSFSGLTCVYTGGECFTIAAELAAGDWNDAGARFTFTTRSAFADPCIQDGINGVGFGLSLCGSSFPPGTLAVALSSSSPTGQILESGVVFNIQPGNGFFWDVYEGPERQVAGTPVIDFYRIAIHEFGHVLGLSHPDDYGQRVRSIMNATASNLDRLQPDDIRGIHAIYGSRTPLPASKGNLENPGRGTTMSGVGVISGWKCDAGELTVRFNGGAPLPLLYGSVRTDVRDAGACPSAEVGFVALWNWGNLGDGQHTAVVYDDGREFARSTFRVVTTGEAFLPDVEGQCVVPDFPAPGENALFTWTTGTQHLELTDVGRHIQPPSQQQHLFDGRWDFRLTTQGTCRRRPPATLWIDITQSSLVHIDEDAVATFAVLDTGQLEGQITDTANHHVISFTGLLTGRAGEGVWFNIETCAGTWTATKR